MRGRFGGHEIASVYFGGGTPSLFPQGIGQILKQLRLTSNCEVTVEANPEECSLALFEELREYGVNRLSLGVQSLDDRALQSIERTHTAGKAKDAIRMAKEAGFANVSIDLMYDLPEQTVASFAYTLEQVEELSITHVSLYNLTVEPHTSFAKRPPKQPDGATSLHLLELAVRKLEAAGLARYEISAFAKPGYSSRHNLGYWTGRPFWGFGPSAFSYWEGERFRNTANLNRYTALLREGKSPVDFREKLPIPECVNERFAVHLRLLEGAPVEGLPHETMEAIERLIGQGLLRRTAERVQLTDRGLLFYDTVATELI